MNKLRKPLILVVALFFLALASLAGDKTITLRSVLFSDTPGMNVFTAGQPGENTVLPRAYLGAPPVIPHEISTQTINTEDHDCLVCHIPANEGQKPTPIPQSHYLNPFTQEKTSENVIGMRYYCLQCHVPQANEEPPYKSR